LISDFRFQRLPYDNWQFWAVTALFVLAGVWLLRGVIPVPVLSARHRRRKRERRVNLTVGGKSPK
jgi:hypothetical protein